MRGKKKFFFHTADRLEWFYERILYSYSEHNTQNLLIRDILQGTEPYTANTKRRMETLLGK